MHIPYGVLSTEVAVATGAITVPFVGWALHKVKSQFKEKSVPTMGMLGAFLFVAQMINFPVTAGTSGHLIGAALATYLVGAPAAIIVMSTVIFVQAFLFQDGAITALGANIFNMGIVTVFCAYITFLLWKKVSKNKAPLVGMGAGAFVSTVVASAVCSVELAMSNLYPLKLVLSTMVSVHTLIGIGEAVITIGILKFLMSTRPDVVQILAKGESR